MDEQAAELVYRQQHDLFSRLVRAAEEEKNRAVQDGQRARQEMANKTQELQRVYESAGAFAQQKDQIIEQTHAEMNEWRRVAQERDGVVQFLENRMADTQAYI